MSTNVDDVNNNIVDIKPCRRRSFSSAIRQTSLTKRPKKFSSSTIDSTTRTQIPSSSTKYSVNSNANERNLLKDAKVDFLKSSQNKNSSNNNNNIRNETLSYRKNFMQKIERFRFIDDSASNSTNTTVASPVESIEQENLHQTSDQLISSNNQQFDEYFQIKYNDNNMNSFIDYLDSDQLINGSYSDLNILDNISSTNAVLHSRTIKPVNDQSFQIINVSYLLSI